MCENIVNFIIQWILGMYILLHVYNDLNSSIPKHYIEGKCFPSGVK